MRCRPVERIVRRLRQENIVEHNLVIIAMIAFPVGTSYCVPLYQKPPISAAESRSRYNLTCVCVRKIEAGQFSVTGPSKAACTTFAFRVSGTSAKTCFGFSKAGMVSEKACFGTWSMSGKCPSPTC